jgi:hypothetical protein
VSGAPNEKGSILRRETHRVPLVAHAAAQRTNRCPVTPPAQVHHSENLIRNDRRVMKRTALHLVPIWSVQGPSLPTVENRERVHCPTSVSSSTGSRTVTTHEITVPSQSSAPEPRITPT